MSRVFYVFFIAIIAFVAIFVIFLMFAYHSKTHIAATDLNEGVTETLQNSRDDSARMERGVYAVNQYEFEDIFAHHLNITNLNTSHNQQRNYYFVIRFQKDNSNTDKEDNTFTSDYQNPYSVPTRSVQVIAVPKKDIQGNDNQEKLDSAKNQLGNITSKLNAKKFVSTVIMQEFDLDANHGLNHTQLNNRDPQSYQQKLYGDKNGSSDTHTENNTGKTDNNGNNISSNSNVTDLSDNN